MNVKDLWVITELKKENIDFKRIYCDNTGKIYVSLGQREKYDKIDSSDLLESIVQDGQQINATIDVKYDCDEVFIIIDLSDHNNIHVNYAIFGNNEFYEDLNEIVKFKLVKVLYSDKKLYKKLKNTYNSFIKEILEWIKVNKVRPVISKEYKDCGEFVHDEINQTAYSQVRKPVGEELNFDNIIIAAIDPWYKKI